MLVATISPTVTELLATGRAAVVAFGLRLAWKLATNIEGTY